MTISKQNVGKFSIVVFLTLLIWVWADLSQDDKHTLEQLVSVSVNNEASSSWWMIFYPESSDSPSQSILLDELVLKGPARAIQRIKQDRNLDLGLLVSPDGAGGEGKRSFDLLAFLQDSDIIHNRGVTVESCIPEKIEIEVVAMVKARVPVHCYDENGQRLQEAIVTPEKIEAFVPKEWAVSKQVAKVILNSDQMNNARTQPVLRTPFIEILPHQEQMCKLQVDVQMPPMRDLREDLQVSGRHAFLVGTNIQNKYQVVLDTQDLANLIALIKIKATPAARDAYEAQSYQVIIEIDAETTEPQQVELQYNFPKEFYRKGEIELNQPPAMARFHLVPIAPAEVESSN